MAELPSPFYCAEGYPELRGQAARGGAEPAVLLLATAADVVRIWVPQVWVALATSC